MDHRSNSIRFGRYWRNKFLLRPVIDVKKIAHRLNRSISSNTFGLVKQWAPDLNSLPVSICRKCSVQSRRCGHWVQPWVMKYPFLKTLIQLVHRGCNDYERIGRLILIYLWHTALNSLYFFLTGQLSMVYMFKFYWCKAPVSNNGKGYSVCCGILYYWYWFYLYIYR